MSIAASPLRRQDASGPADFDRMESERETNPHLLRMRFSPELERQITEPHSRELGSTGIVWLIWLYKEDEEYTCIPQLSCVCTNEYSVRVHLGMLVQQEEMARNRVPLRSTSPRDWALWLDSLPFRFYVERAPLDHSFGSELLAKAQREMIFTPPIRVGAARKLPYGGE